MKENQDDIKSSQFITFGVKIRFYIDLNNEILKQCLLDSVSRI